MENAITVRSVENRIFIVRGHKVILDSDLAVLYRVETRTLIQSIKRNKRRFPLDFMFQLTFSEFENLKSQFVISSWGGRRSLPYVFTEQGIAMLSSVLNSVRAIQVNIQIMRAFIRLKTIIAGNEDLRRKIASMERKYDKRFAVVFHAIQKILDGPEKPVHVNGFNLSVRKLKIG